jgi:hypothetical protein
VEDGDDSHAALRELIVASRDVGDDQIVVVCRVGRGRGGDNITREVTWFGAAID